MTLSSPHELQIDLLDIIATFHPMIFCIQYLMGTATKRSESDSPSNAPKSGFPGEIVPQPLPRPAAISARGFAPITARRGTRGDAVPLGFAGSAGGPGATTRSSGTTRSWPAERR